MEIIVKGVDQISPVMKKIKGDTGGVTSFMEANWKKVGLATAGAATAIEMFARKQAPMLEASRKIAAAIDMEEKAFRQLAIETANVTFPLKDVLDLMELGKQAGLDSADSLKDYATFWDTIGDATGESGVQLGKMGVSLRGIGIELGNEKEALAAFGYITESTSGSINDFLMFLDKCGPELREMNMDVNQSASILGVLEKEFGIKMKIQNKNLSFLHPEKQKYCRGKKLGLGYTKEEIFKYFERGPEHTKFNKEKILKDIEKEESDYEKDFRDSRPSYSSDKVLVGNKASFGMSKVGFGIEAITTKISRDIEKEKIRVEAKKDLTRKSKEKFRLKNMGIRRDKIISERDRGNRER